MRTLLSIYHDEELSKDLIAQIKKLITTAHPEAELDLEDEEPSERLLAALREVERGELLSFKDFEDYKANIDK